MLISLLAKSRACLLRLITDWRVIMLGGPASGQMWLLNLLVQSYQLHAKL